MVNVTVAIARAYLRVASIPFKSLRASALLNGDRRSNSGEDRQLDVFSAWLGLSLITGIAFFIGGIVDLGLGAHGGASEIPLLVLLCFTVFAMGTTMVQTLRVIPIRWLISSNAKPYDVLFGVAAAIFLLVELTR